ncbi:cyanophycinase [Massilia pseudoviolaceinigra]|uniref:cyanophycinase n=1 Tax=Massilia pseudoviolaceinigra TaxID=3057165 RepID=UPI0027969A85|nr:cyanophycinase [Massilia sp. CCM 9206]MDQ1924819.1 cyanophycinase [Massilia sp. CCM 9206]
MDETTDGPRHGHLLIVGGSEDRQHDMRVLTRFVELCGGVEQPVAVMTAASEIGDQVFEMYRVAFAELGVTHMTHVHLDSPKEAASEKLLSRIREAKGIFMAGGDQKRLLEMIGGTPVHAEIATAFARGACIAGTSAGASAMSRFMLAEGKAELEPEKGAIRLGVGLGFVERIVVDQHFAQRKRLPRLLSIIAERPDLYGVGIDEDTALLISPGIGIEVIGGGAVTLVDGLNMISNIDELDTGDVPRLIDVRLHLLPTGTRFDAAADESTRVPPPFQDFFDALIQPEQREPS